jgi:hypothetical protein
MFGIRSDKLTLRSPVDLPQRPGVPPLINRPKFRNTDIVRGPR